VTVAAWHALVIAQRPQGSPWLDPRVLWATLSLVVILLLGAAVLALVDRWRKRPAPDRLSPGDQLSHFRTLYEQGQLSREEFERIRGRLSRELRAELDLPAVPPAPSPSPLPPRVRREGAGPPEPPPPPPTTGPPAPPGG
jgi:hypothetical protein